MLSVRCGTGVLILARVTIVLAVIFDIASLKCNKTAISQTFRQARRDSLSAMPNIIDKLRAESVLSGPCALTSSRIAPMAKDVAKVILGYH
jgi:hypothetical protein